MSAHLQSRADNLSGRGTYLHYTVVYKHKQSAQEVYTTVTKQSLAKNRRGCKYDMTAALALGSIRAHVIMPGQLVRMSGQF